MRFCNLGEFNEQLYVVTSGIRDSQFKTDLFLYDSVYHHEILIISSD